jgi:hypothetical protein
MTQKKKEPYVQSMCYSEQHVGVRIENPFTHENIDGSKQHFTDRTIGHKTEIQMMQAKSIPCGTETRKLKSQADAGKLENTLARTTAIWRSCNTTMCP